MMTSRNRNNVKIETTIENCRSEGKWQRVIELAEELKTGSPDYGKQHRATEVELKVKIFDFHLLQNVYRIS